MQGCKSAHRKADNMRLVHIQMLHEIVDVGAGALTVTLPEEGRFDANLSVGAGELTVIIPDGLEARIERNLGVGDINVDQSRFVRDGDAFVTRGLDEADSRVVLNLDVGVGEIQVR